MPNTQNTHQLNAGEPGIRLQPASLQRGSGADARAKLELVQHFFFLDVGRA